MELCPYTVSGSSWTVQRGNSLQNYFPILVLSWCFFFADEPLISTGFVRWSHSHLPDNYGGNDTHPGEDCGSMHTNGGLNDLPCSSQVPFICEQELW